MEKKSDIDNSIYHSYGDRWYTAFDDPIALLRSEAKVTGPWIEKILSKHFSEPQSTSVLDIGCGGGFLSNRLAASHYKVTGCDLASESLEVARRHDLTQTVNYITADAYHLPFDNGTFDVVTAMDFLEHVDHPGKVIAEASRVLKPNGLFFFHTFNRNFLSKFVIIKLPEWFVKNTPKNLHVPELFITIDEFRKYNEDSGLTIKEMLGTKPNLTSWTLKSLWTREVPKNFSFSLIKSTKLSYLGYSQKI